MIFKTGYLKIIAYQVNEKILLLIVSTIELILCSNHVIVINFVKSHDVINKI